MAASVKEDKVCRAAFTVILMRWNDDDHVFPHVVCRILGRIAAFFGTRMNPHRWMWDGMGLFQTRFLPLLWFDPVDCRRQKGINVERYSGCRETTGRHREGHLRA